MNTTFSLEFCQTLNGCELLSTRSWLCVIVTTPFASCQSDFL